MKTLVKKYQPSFEEMMDAFRESEIYKELDVLAEEYFKGGGLKPDSIRELIKQVIEVCQYIESKQIEVEKDQSGDYHG